MSTPPPTLLALVGANPQPLVAHLLDWEVRTALAHSSRANRDTLPAQAQQPTHAQAPEASQAQLSALRHVVLCVPLAWAESTQKALAAAGCLGHTSADADGSGTAATIPQQATDQPLPRPGSGAMQEGLHRTVQGNWSITWLVGEPATRLPQVVCHASEVWLADEHAAVDSLAKPIARLCLRGAQLVGQGPLARLAPAAWQAWLQAGFVAGAPHSEPPGSATVLSSRPTHTIHTTTQSEALSGTTRRSPPPGHSELLAHYAPRWPVPKPSSMGQFGASHAVVIGAGLAGAALCASLTRRGWQVDLLDQHSGPAQGASALPVGMLSEHVTANETLLSELSRTGMAWHWAQLQALVPVGEGWQPCQVTNLRDTGAEHPNSLTLPAALVRPAALVKAWLAQAQATGLLRTHWHANVARLKPVAAPDPSGDPPQRPGELGKNGASGTPQAAGESGEMPNPTGVAQGVQTRQTPHLPAIEGLPASPLQWQVLDDSGHLLAQAPYVVVASAHGSVALLSPWVAPTASGGAGAPHPSDPPAALPLRPVKGQMSYGALTGEPHAAHPLRDHGVYVPCYEDRLHPSAPRLWAMGSTYTRGVNDSSVRQEDHGRNADSLKAMLPPAHALMAQQQAQGTLLGWAQVRCASQDRLPLAGAVPAPQALKPNAQLPTVARWPGLWTLTALGSRGLTLSMLGAELVVARMLGEPWPLTRHQAEALDPARFALKAARADHAAHQVASKGSKKIG